MPHNAEYACCDEPRCRRSQPIRLSRSGLTGRWYFITRWKDQGEGRFEAVEKHYVGDEAQLRLGMGSDPPETVALLDAPAPDDGSGA